MSKLLTAHDVAEELGIAPCTVWRLARTGDLPAVRLGGRTVRFMPEALRAYLERGGNVRKAGSFADR